MDSSYDLIYFKYLSAGDRNVFDYYSPVAIKSIDIFSVWKGPASSGEFHADNFRFDT